MKPSRQFVGGGLEMATPVLKLSFRLPRKDRGHASTAVYVKYIACHSAERDRFGHPLFGPDPVNPPDINAVRRSVKVHRGPIWRLILSLREDDALRWGYVSRQDWEDLVRDAMLLIVQAMGLNQMRVRWVAALHRPPGHSHVHVVLWEDPPLDSAA